jgi:hypothetical protein
MFHAESLAEWWFSVDAAEEVAELGQRRERGESKLLRVLHQGQTN